MMEAIERMRAAHDVMCQMFAFGRSYDMATEERKCPVCGAELSNGDILFECVRHKHGVLGCTECCYVDEEDFSLRDADTGEIVEDDAFYEERYVFV